MDNITRNKQPCHAEIRQSVSFLRHLLSDRFLLVYANGRHFQSLNDVVKTISIAATRPRRTFKNMHDCKLISSKSGNGKWK